MGMLLKEKHTLLGPSLMAGGHEVKVHSHTPYMIIKHTSENLSQMSETIGLYAVLHIENYFENNACLQNFQC